MRAGYGAGYGPAVPETSTRLRILVALVALEALTLLVLAVVLGIGLAVDRTSTQVGFVLAEVGLAALGAAILGLIARGIHTGRRWARGGLAITLQLIGLPFGVRLAEFGYWYAAVPALAVVLGALVLLFGLQQPPDPESE